MDQTRTRTRTRNSRFCSEQHFLGRWRLLSVTSSVDVAESLVDNGGRCDLRVSFVLSVLRFFSRTFAGAIDKESLSRLA